MGDRCTLTIHIRLDDLKDEKYAEVIRFNLLDGQYKDVHEMIQENEDSSNHPQVIVLTLEEINYGGEEILGNLADAGLLFIGGHSQGDSYGPSRFYSSGVSGGSVTYIEEGLQGGIVIYYYSDKDGTVPEKELERLRVSLQGYHKAERRLYASPLEQIAQAASEES